MKKKEFESVLKNNKKIYSRNLICYFLKNSSPNIRVAVLISKKNIKKAVKRNYYKRLFKAAILDQLKTGPKFDCVFFYKKVFFENPNFQILKNDIKSIMKELQKK